MATRKGIYQSAETFQKWALDCYRRAWKEHAANVPYEDPPPDLLQTVRAVWSRPITY
jgi:hypothetical protein